MRGRKRACIHWMLSKCLQWPGLGYAKTRMCNLGLPPGWEGPSCLRHHGCLPGCALAGCRSQKVEVGIQPKCSGMGCGHKHPPHHLGFLFCCYKKQRPGSRCSSLQAIPASKCAVMSQGGKGQNASPVAGEGDAGPSPCSRLCLPAPGPQGRTLVCT